MTASLLQIALDMLFAGAGGFAIAVLAGSWRAARGPISALRSQLAALADGRDLQLPVVRTQVRFTPPRRAFTAQAVRPVPVSLRAA
jgi:hypothetical protein